MSYIPISNNPVYNEQMTALETTTPANASYFNERYKQCLENEKSIKQQVGDLKFSVTAEGILRITYDNGL